MEPRLVTSSLLPVPHGFSTREGGVSRGEFSSLNTSFSAGDEPAAVAENLRRLCAAGQVAPARLRTVSQVHGDAVREVEDSRPGEAPPPAEGEADALWTAVAGEAVGVRTADCVPLLLVDPDGKRVAAVHSGWRGTDLQIAAKAVRALCAKGARPERLLAAIGPSIRGCCYQVSEELGQRFAGSFSNGVVLREGGKWQLDLVEAVAQTLAAAGLKPAHIDPVAPCTACEKERFFSHRRDQGRTGRQLSFVACRF